MKTKINILIVSIDPWDDSNSFGSTFSNIFGGNDNYEITNVYCGMGAPQTNVCKNFFQITEKGILKSFFKKGTCSGSEISVRENAGDFSVNERRVYDKLRILRWTIFFWIRNLIWATGKWKSNELIKFVKEKKIDIVFQPIYYSTYVNEIGVFFHKRLRVPMVGYISDDDYACKRYSWSPLFWIDRFITRKYVKRAIDRCQVLYTMTNKQKEEYGRIFGPKFRILYKGGSFSKEPVPFSLHSPIRFLYTGNLTGGRWKTLMLIGKALSTINKDGLKAQLKIYSKTPLTNNQLQKLSIGESCIFCGGIPASEVKETQRGSDVLIHVESFEKKERYSARLSFSTKIVDYMEAHRCILAVGWEETAAIEVLKENDIAFVVTDNKTLESEIARIVSDHKRMFCLADRAFDYGKQYHDIDIIRNNLYKDFLAIINN